MTTGDVFVDPPKKAGEAQQKVDWIANDLSLRGVNPDLLDWVYWESIATFPDFVNPANSRSWVNHKLAVIHKASKIAMGPYDPISITSADRAYVVAVSIIEASRQLDGGKANLEGDTTSLSDNLLTLQRLAQQPVSTSPSVAPQTVAVPVQNVVPNTTQTVPTGSAPVQQTTAGTAPPASASPGGTAPLSFAERLRRAVFAETGRSTFTVHEWNWYYSRETGNTAPDPYYMGFQTAEEGSRLITFDAWWEGARKAGVSEAGSYSDPTGPSVGGGSSTDGGGANSGGGLSGGMSSGGGSEPATGGTTGNAAPAKPGFISALLAMALSDGKDALAAFQGAGIKPFWK
jgi:hypothetical protein